MLMCCLSAGHVRAEDTLPQPTRIITYKTVGDVELKLHVFEPAGRAEVVQVRGGSRPPESAQRC